MHMAHVHGIFRHFGSSPFEPSRQAADGALSGVFVCVREYTPKTHANINWGTFARVP
jgi:hypothetical protein